MKTIKLIREQSDDQGTYGKLMIGAKSFNTIELPWRENRSNKSCIPIGTYKVIWSRSPRLNKFTYEILGVTNRAGIRIHGGNVAGNEDVGFISHSLGCPLLGKIRSKIKGQKAVGLSRVAVEEFQQLMNKETFLLEITNA